MYNVQKHIKKNVKKNDSMIALKLCQSALRQEAKQQGSDGQISTPQVADHPGRPAGVYSSIMKYFNDDNDTSMILF